MLPRLFGDRSLFSPFLRGDLSLFPGLLRLRSLFLSPQFLSLCAEELSCFDVRASSPLIYFSALASTSAMVTYGFFEMETIKSFDCTLSPVMKAVMANFSSGTSTFKDFALNFWTYDLRFSWGCRLMVSK